MTNSSDEPANSKQNRGDFIGIDENIQNVNVTRPVSAQEITYLINRYPYLRVFDAQADFSKIFELPYPNFVRADTGWIMQDYGFYICSSLGDLLYGNYAWALGADEEGGEGAADLNPGKGTLVKQAFDTAAEMVALGKSHGWEAIHILEGNELMEWAAWLISEELGLKVEGYEPARQDKEKRDRLKRGGRLDEMGVRLRLY